MPNIPIVNAPNLYVNDLQIAVTGDAALTMASGQARDSTNVADIILGDSVTINTDTNGANALDTGSLANSTWYAVYVIGSSGNLVETAAIVSASATAPYLPSGYDIFRQIGWVLTDGTADLLSCYIYGNDKMRVHRWGAVMTELSAQGSASYTALDLNTSVAPTANLVYLQWLLLANTAGNVFNLRPTGSESISNIGAGNPVIAPASMIGMISAECDDDQSIDWKTTSADDDLTLWTAGFTYFI